MTYYFLFLIHKITINLKKLIVAKVTSTIKILFQIKKSKWRFEDENSLIK